MTNTVTERVNTDHGSDFHPVADHNKVTKFHQELTFSGFLFSFQLMFNQTLTSLIVRLMISDKTCINELTWILGRFNFSQN